jgi:hypothetical protein
MDKHQQILPYSLIKFEKKIQSTRLFQPNCLLKFISSRGNGIGTVGIWFKSFHRLDFVIFLIK